MDPSKRISFWEKCGAKPININYIQPPLSQDKEAISNLTLMALPLERGKQIILEKNILIKFLSDFYIGLCCGDSIFLKKMIEERDYDDMHRPVGSLTRTEDQIYIDSSDKSIDEVVKIIIDIVGE